MSEVLNMMTWNIKSGGFASYDPSLVYPEREDAIRNIVARAHTEGSVSAVTLPDAYRWDETYGPDTSIASHLGYKAARFVRLDDERLNRDNGAGIGIAFATDHAIEQTKVLDLETRQGLAVTIAVGKRTLQIANVYLDDLSEDIRLRQVRALHAGLEKGVPTVLTGDFNALRPNAGSAELKTRLADGAVRGAVLAGRVLDISRVRIPPRYDGINRSIRGMDKRRVVRQLNAYGYSDADEVRKRPTAPSRLPLFGIDYVFGDRGVRLDEPIILSTRFASDHNALVTKIAIL